MTISANYVNEYTFITHGTNNFTEEFHSGRRVRSYCGVDGYKYGTVSGSFYLESTTVVLYPDIDNELTSNLESVEYGIVGTLNGSMPNHSHLNDESQGGLLFEASIVDLDKYTTGEIDNMLATLSGSIHDSVSLSVELSTNLLDISTQQLTLNNQEANTVFAGPSTGTENIPSFRKLVAEDIPVLGYLIPASDGVTSSSWTINSSKADVTSSLVFGRTTGGNATLSYNGYGFNLSHPVGIGVYPNYDLEVYNAGIARIGLGRNQNAREFVIEKDTDSPYGSSIYFTYTPTGGYGFLRLMASQDTEVARFVGADQSTLLNGQLIVDLGAKSVPTVLFKRDFVTNPFSALVDTHVWGNIMPYNYSFGGINIYGYSSSDSGGVALTGLIGSNSPTSTTPAVLIRGGKFNGVNSGGAVATTERVLQIDNWGSNIAHINGAGSLSLLGNLTINSSKADVTSSLVFGRTTGGDATISWNGSYLISNAPSYIPRLGVGASPGSGFLQVSTNLEASAAGWGLYVTGASGEARNIALFGQAGYSNGFTVTYNGTNMVYSFGAGSVYVGNNITLNNNRANVTSTLTFGRTTGGDATINWDGSKLYTSKPLKVNENNYGDPSTSPNKIILWQSADYNYFGFGISSSTLDYFSQSIHRWHTQYTGTPGVVAMTLNSTGSLSLLGNLTINSSKADVTSSLVFGRTTGGDATISWDGTSLTTNKSLTINSSTTVAMNRFITSNGLAGCVYATRTSAANTDAYFGFLDAKESWAYYFRTDSSHVWKVNNIDKMYLNDTTLTTTGNLYVGGNVSAESFTDRTPFFQGDALSEIMNIKGKDGEIDHSSLPSFARKEITKRRFEDVELTTEVDAKDAYIYDTRTVEVKGVKQEEIIEDSKKLKDTVYEDEKTGKFYEKNSVGEVKIKDGKPYQSIDVGEEIEQGRDLGAMISMLTVAVQQLTNRLSDIEKWAEKFGEASRQE